uniref:Bifunctional protein FolD n=3 Tax=Lygus hesperus TaxID=30085 RepID=A0A146LLS5_LYGHE
MRILRGVKLAKQLREQIRRHVLTLTSAQLPRPTLHILCVGDENPSQQIYVRNKIAACQECGIVSHVHQLSQDTTSHALYKSIVNLNSNPDVHGILLQLPLPKQLSPMLFHSCVDPTKDVDGLATYNVGNLALHGRHAILIPCTPVGIVRLLQSHGVLLHKKFITIVGRSNLVGKPLSVLLQSYNATVTLCHSNTPNLAQTTRHADIVITATGVPNLIQTQHVAPNAYVVDVGITTTAPASKKIVGDADFNALAPRTYATVLPIAHMYVYICTTIFTQMLLASHQFLGVWDP